MAMLTAYETAQALWKLGELSESPVVIDRTVLLRVSGRPTTVEVPPLLVESVTQELTYSGLKCWSLKRNGLFYLYGI